MFYSWGNIYANNNDLVKRTVLGKVLEDRAYEIAIKPTYDGY